MKHPVFLQAETGDAKTQLYEMILQYVSYIYQVYTPGNQVTCKTILLIRAFPSERKKSRILTNSATIPDVLKVWNATFRNVAFKKSIMFFFSGILHLWTSILMKSFETIKSPDSRQISRFAKNVTFLCRDFWLFFLLCSLRTALG